MKIIIIFIAITTIACSNTVKQYEYPKSPCKRKYSAKINYNEKFLKTKGINIFVECENVI